VSLFGGTNPDFFEGTVVAAAARAELTRSSVDSGLLTP
jgi:hypothetical protein